MLMDFSRNYSIPKILLLIQILITKPQSIPTTKWNRGADFSRNVILVLNIY